MSVRCIRSENWFTLPYCMNLEGVALGTETAVNSESRNFKGKNYPGLRSLSYYSDGMYLTQNYLNQFLKAEIV